MPAHPPIGVSAAIPSPRRLAAVVAILAGVLALVGLTPYAAHAAQTATWTADGSNDHWDNADNWDTGTVPGPDDVAIIHELPAQVVKVDQLGAVTVAGLQVLGGPGEDVQFGNDGAGSITVTGSMTWTGGDIGVPVTVPAGGTLTFGAGHDKFFKPETGAQITVAGTAVVDHTGVGEGDEIRFFWDSGLTIAPGGRLVSHGTAQLGGNRCCGVDFPSAVDNRGTISVPDGHLTIQTMGLYNSGTVDVAASATLTDDQGIARLGEATYSGGGRLEFTHTTTPGPQPEHADRNQGGALLLGTGHLADGFTVNLGADTELTGVGGFAGSGAVELDGATVYARATLGGSVRLALPAGSQSWLWTYDGDLAGYHGDLTLGAGGAVGAGAHLTVHPGSRLTVSGGTLGVGKGSFLDSDSCCASTPEVLVGKHGRLDFRGATGSPATLKWLTVRNAGTIRATGPTSWISATVTQVAGTLALGSLLTTDRTDLVVTGGVLSGNGTYVGDVTNNGGTVRPSGTLHVDGAYTQRARGTLSVVAGTSPTKLAVTGAATLGGTLLATSKGHKKAGTTQAVLSAGSRAGHFGCARTVGWLPAYRAKAVTLTRIGTSAQGCLHYVKPHPVVSKRVTAKKGATAKVSVGAKADQVLLRVLLSRASATTKVRLWAAGRKVTVRVGRGHKASAWLLVPVGRGHTLHVRPAKGTVTTKVLQYGWVG